MGKRWCADPNMPGRKNSGSKPSDVAAENRAGLRFSIEFLYFTGKLALESPPPHHSLVGKCHFPKNAAFKCAEGRAFSR